MENVTKFPVRRRRPITPVTAFQRLHGIIEDAESLPSSFTADDVEKIIQRLSVLRDSMVSPCGGGAA